MNSNPISRPRCHGVRRHAGHAMLSIMALLLASTLTGCATHPAYTSPEYHPNAWSVTSVSSTKQDVSVPSQWWTLLHDPAINALIEATFADNPTLARAVSRIDEARATLDVNAAQRLPNVGAGANVARAQQQNTAGLDSGLTLLSSSASLEPSVSWELDLFGRLRESTVAAENRLNARTADATTTRLSLATEIANDTLVLRACENTVHILSENSHSFEKTLSLIRQKFDAGFVAQTDVARAVSDSVTAHANLAVQREQCSRQMNALIALSGKEPQVVRKLIDIPPIHPDHHTTSPIMAIAPDSAPQLPATVLIHHPNVISADQEAAAAWAEIGIAKANRLPKLDLMAVLTGQWIRAAGTSLNLTTWSIGPSLTGTVFDAGAGAANVSAAEARYRQAAANLQSTVRSTVQDVENALAAQASAKERLTEATKAVNAAHITLKAAETQWKAGAGTLIELENSRRQYALASDTEISAQRDQAQAWVALVKATGGTITLIPEHTDHE